MISVKLLFVFCISTSSGMLTLSLCPVVETLLLLQVASQYMFEETFNLQFRTLFDQYNSTHSSDTLERIGSNTLARIQSINSLGRAINQGIV